MSAFQRNATEWELNARRNPLWAILTDRERESQTWDIDDFFRTGEHEVKTVLDYVATLGATLEARGCFLDFGCGVGRNTRALMRRFAAGIGVDVSGTMIELARQYSASDPVQAAYLVNHADRLSTIPDQSVDFVYCHIVLQHLPPSLQPGFVAEFLRILRPGGIAAFQVPTGDTASPMARSWREVKSGVRGILPAALVSPIRRAMGKGTQAAAVTMSMHVLPEATVERLVESAGCVRLAAPYTNSTDTSHRGNLRFMDRATALAAIESGETDSRLLSQFFFVARPRPA